MTQALADAAAVKAEQFFNACAVVFPPSVISTVQSDVEQIDAATGELTNVWNVPARTGTAGTNAGSNFSGPSGMVVTWRTAGVRNGRRVRGRTFLVPCAVNVYENNGTIVAATLTSVQTAANSLIADSANLELGVWARPIKDSNGAVTTPGEWHNVQTATVPDKVAVLRSRRD